MASFFWLGKRKADTPENAGTGIAVERPFPLVD